MNIERMRHLLVVMEQVKKRNEEQPHDHFYWGDWVRLAELNEKRRLEALAETATDIVELPWSCGTTACVLGHAGFDPVFRAQGLTVGIPPQSHILGVWLKNNGRFRLLGEDAGNVFFDLTQNQGDFLWFGPKWAPIDEAIARIKFLLDHPNEQYPKSVYCGPPTFTDAD